MNIFRWEFKRLRKLLLAWTLAFVLLQFMYSSFFPSMASEEGGLLLAKLNMLPKVFLKMFGLENLDLTNILHYYAMQGQFIVILIGSVFAAKIGSNIVVKEESDKTAEFLLAKPVTRSRILTGKLLSTIVCIAVFDIIIMIANLAFFNIYNTSDTFDFELFWLLSIAPLMIHIVVGLLSFMISVLQRKTGRADIFSLGVVFSLYAASVLAKLTEKLELLKFFTPYSYFDPSNIVKTRSFEATYITLFFIEILGLIIVSYIHFRKKDVYI
ncbi:MAG: beta-exotoxin transport system permease protein [Thermotogaceae bacterium]|jgi:ABC-2 type transport system permease protein|nr:beta-exotoxin transport system permease protein [Thermotogaceae bacterium]